MKIDTYTFQLKEATRDWQGQRKYSYREEKRRKRARLVLHYLMHPEEAEPQAIDYNNNDSYRTAAHAWNIANVYLFEANQESLIRGCSPYIKEIMEVLKTRSQVVNKQFKLTL